MGKVGERGKNVLPPPTQNTGYRFRALLAFGRGFLTGAAKPGADYDESDLRRTDAHFQLGNLEKNLEATEKLTALARSEGAAVLRGCSRKATTSSRFPARAASNASKRTLE